MKGEYFLEKEVGESGDSVTYRYVNSHTYAHSWYFFFLSFGAIPSGATLKFT